MNNLELIQNHLKGPFKDTLLPIICKELNIEEGAIDSALVLLQSEKGSKEQKEALSTVLSSFDKTIKQKYGIALVVADNNIKNQISARNMAVSTKSKVPEFLSIMITAGFFSVLGYLLLNDSRPNETLLVMLGSLGTAWVAVVNYWFGSSSGSAYKSELLERMHKT